MNLFNKKILQEYIQKFQFPTGSREYGINAILEGLVNSFLLSNLEKTKETSVQSLFLQRVFDKKIQKVTYAPLFQKLLDAEKVTVSTNWLAKWDEFRTSE